MTTLSNLITQVAALDHNHDGEYATVAQVLTNVPAGAVFTDTVYNHPATHPWSMIDTTPTTLAGYGITDAATSAQGALADTAVQPAALNDKVNVSQVLTDVPLGAVFTDTIYNHPATHPWSMINSTPTTLAGYGITDAATSAQGALADTAIQPNTVAVLTGLHVNSTGAIELPAGLTSEQPVTPSAGMLRFNTETASFEGYTTEWGAIGGGGGGLTISRQTTTYTAETNQHIFADTSSAAWTLTLPSTPAEGDLVVISDYSSTFSTNTLTVARNGSTIQGGAADAVLSISNQEYAFVYLNSDWKVFMAPSLAGIIAERYLTGPTTGNETTDISLNIQNWTINDTYIISVTGGSYVQTNDLIVWTLPGVSANTTHTMTLTLVGGATYEHNVYVVNIPVSPDTSISVTNFSLNDSNIGWTI